jgi:CHAT domain-containing protein
MTPESATSGAESEVDSILRELRRLPRHRRLERLAASPSEPAPTGGDTLEARMLAVIDEAGRMTMVSAAEAAEATACVVELADETKLDFARARARRARARALAYAGRFDEALVVCSEAISIATGCGRLDEVGRARLASMHALTEMGRLDEAIDAGRAARETFEKLGEGALAARADNNLGIVFQRRDEPAAAIECFERARPLLLDDPVALGHLENSRGEALLALNDFAGAEEAFAAALAAFDRSQADLTSAIAEGNLGDLAMRRGRLREALHYFERARRRLERSDSPGHLARLMAEQAEAKALMGLTGESLADYERALAELEACGMPLEAARARTAMGMAALGAGRWSQAETALAAAAVAFEELRHGTARARVDLARAELAARNGRLRDARTLALRALAVLDCRPVDAAAARHLLGTLAMQMGEPELAEHELLAAAGIAEQLDIAPMQCEIHHSLGRLYRAAGQPSMSEPRLEKAIAHLSLAVECAERLRSTIQAERFRTAVIGQRASLHEELASCLLERGDERSIERAFEVAERCKGRTLLDRLPALAPDVTARDASDQDGDSADRELLERMRLLHEELNALYSRLGDERFAGHHAGGLRLWRVRVRELEADLGDVEARLAATGGRGLAALHAPSATFAEVRSVLGPHQALIEYFSIGEDLAAFVITSDAPPIALRLPGMRRIEERLDRLQFQIDRALRHCGMNSTQTSASGPSVDGSRLSVHAEAQDRLLADTRRELGALYEHLAAPVEARLDAIGGRTELIIVPHGALHVLPFHALWDASKSQYLDERFTIRTAPSASVLSRQSAGLRRAAAAGGGTALVVAVADEVVPNVLAEGREVATTLGGDVLAGREATIANVRQGASRAGILHLACHGRFDASMPLSSGLRLADGWMTIRDICGLRLDADLVFLSACETGLGRVESGDEVLGLQRAFLAAGARGLLLTLWRVPDESTADFARLFYSAWDNGGGSTHRTEGSGPECRASIAVIARGARAALRTQHAHPAVWAPFTVAGGGE